MRKGLFTVFIANIINLFFSIVSSFFLPRYLSVESYGHFKLFQLYINYLGVAHLGYADGVYLKYGGMKIQNIDTNELLLSSATIRSMQILIAVIAVVIFGALQNTIAVLLAFSCVPVNMVTYYKNLYQATGEFKNYGIILSLSPIMMFICNMFLLFVFTTDNYIYYMLVVFCSNLVLYIFLEHKSKCVLGKVRLFTVDLKMLKDNIRTGITLTVGNFASILITSIDRWCIQCWMTIAEFSYYSFAVSVENLFNVCLSAITTTLYNYLCQIKINQKIIELKSVCTIVSIYFVAIAFPIKLFIQKWLPKYEASIPCLFILICAHAFYFVIKSIYINLYKARGQQKHYFNQMLVILLVAITSNVIAYWGIAGCMESFAFASLFTAILWYFICYFEFKDIRGQIQEVILLFWCGMIYLFCGLKVSNSIWGCMFYLISVTMAALILCKESFLSFINMIMRLFVQLWKGKNRILSK